MDEERPLFILAGNAAYENRGCEAIIRGTVKILRKSFKDPRFICISHFLSEQQYQQQCLQETDEAITHLHSHRPGKKEIARNFWKPSYLGYAYDHFFHRESLKYRIYRQMLPYLNEATAVLSVGGDNYSLDYGIPKLFTDLDDIAIQKGKPIILWGASVGPFSAMPDYEQYMSDHLQKVTGIFARESATIDYLKGIGVTENVYPVADPAFLMDPVKPVGIEDDLPIEEDSIGLNLSPLMAKYVTGGDLEEWIRIAAQIISQVAETTGRPVFLIPHVTSPHSDDHAFMRKAVSQIKGQNRNITLIPPKYSAAEIKWIISQMALFAGARTHSTIAALSSGVPTLSFAYSIKARGINRDIFDHESYLLSPECLTPSTVTERIQSMLDESGKIRGELDEKIPLIQETALRAGKYLKTLVE